MKKYIIFALIAVAAGTIFIIGGCEKDEEFSRYPSITIPFYGEKDYYALLSSKNPTIVYNAICNMGRYAAKIGSTLSDEKIDKDSKEYILRTNIYNKMSSFLGSKDKKIASASLRFFQVLNINSSYKSNKEIVGRILKIKSPHPEVYFEQIELLKRITDKDTPAKVIDDVFVLTALENRPWLASRATYALINKLQRDSLRLKAIEKYNKTRDKTEKLLILTALNTNFSNKVFDFLSGELLSSGSKKIRYKIISMLEDGEDKEYILAWLEANYKKLKKEDIKYLYSRNVEDAGNSFDVRVASIFVKNGYLIDEEELKEIYPKIALAHSKKEEDEEAREYRQALLKLEEDIVAQEALRPLWVAIKDEKSKDHAIAEDLKIAYLDLVDVMAQKTDEVLAEHNVDDEDRQEIVGKILEIKEEISVDTILELFND
ncbi:hypothetical protein ACFL3N_00185 [Candidatus Omnitrophota bacterium]